MDTELLKTFLEVSKTRHFGKAATNLFVTQAAVSARIKQLEDALGVTLFVRSRNNIHLTDEGLRLQPHAETVLLALSQAKQALALQQVARKQVSIGATSGMWHFYLQDQLPAIQKDCNGLALRLIANPEHMLRNMVIEGTLDLAIVYAPIKAAKFEHKSLGEIRLVLASSLESPSLKEALSEDYVLVDWGTYFETFHARHFAEMPPPELQTNMASVAESYVLLEGGSAYLPLDRLKQLGDKLSLVEGAPVFSREVFAVYRADSEKLELAEEILERVAPLAAKLK